MAAKASSPAGGASGPGSLLATQEKLLQCPQWQHESVTLITLKVARCTLMQQLHRKLVAPAEGAAPGQVCVLAPAATLSPSTAC
eukprot:2733294-Amphidinium_carterae.1